MRSQILKGGLEISLWSYTKGGRGEEGIWRVKNVVFGAVFFFFWSFQTKEYIERWFH